MIYYCFVNEVSVRKKEKKKLRFEACFGAWFFYFENTLNNTTCEKICTYQTEEKARWSELTILTNAFTSSSQCTHKIIHKQFRS